MVPDMDLTTLGAFDTGLDATFGQVDAGVDMDWGTLNPAAFTAINQSVTPSTTGQTVSPKDIFRDPGASAPASTAFTNLTSPDLDSPYLMDSSFDTSPMFTTESDMPPTDTWFSLFPENQDNKPLVAEDLGRTVSSQSLTQSASSDNSPAPLVIESRRKSSVTDKSPATPHSAVAGVKPRRRKGPLPPITVNDPLDRAALKRARNTMAARDSRQRKLDHVSTLERKIAELEDDKAKMVADLERYKAICGPLPENSPAESQ